MKNLACGSLVHVGLIHEKITRQTLKKKQSALLPRKIKLFFYVVNALLFLTIIDVSTITNHVQKNKKKNKLE